jgi:hypothetical protein
MNDLSSTPQPAGAIPVTIDIAPVMEELSARHTP